MICFFSFLISNLASAESINELETSRKAATTQQNLAQNNDVPLLYLKQFADVYSRIKQNYIRDIDDEILFESAIRGMMTTLDEYSVYLNENQYENFRSDTQGRFAGIGVELVNFEGFLKVMTPIDDTPAQRAGILTGDLISHIDDKLVVEIKENPFDALKGEPGSKVKLTIIREGLEKPFDITLTRSVIRIQSVKIETLETNYGYVRIAQFQPDTAENLRQSLIKLVHENNGSLKGLVIDLRNNPGGTLASAVDVSDLFLDDGIIVKVKNRYDNTVNIYQADETALFGESKLIILINKGSASAAEIFSGAMQLNQRAILLGNNSYGKGSVQTVMSLNLNAAIKLTTAKYFLGDDSSIDRIGIKPDILFDEDTMQNTKVIKEQAIIQKALLILKSK